MTAEVSVLVPLSPEETFALLTEPERLRRWQAVTARVELRAGGEYRWTIVPGHTAAGTVNELEPGRRLVLSFGWEESDDLAAGGFDGDYHPRTGRGRDKGAPGPQRSHRRAGLGHQQGWNHYAERLVAAARDG